MRYFEIIANKIRSALPYVIMRLRHGGHGQSHRYMTLPWDRMAHEWNFFKLYFFFV